MTGIDGMPSIFLRKNPSLMIASEELLIQDGSLKRSHAWKTKGKKNAEILKKL
jgi:hypothetical protein